MNIDYSEIGSRMAKRRKELGLKQYQVCEMIGVNYKYVSNLETGRSAPSLEIIMKLCEVLKVTPDYLLIGTASSINTADQQLSDKLNRLTPTGKKLANDILNAIINDL